MSAFLSSKGTWDVADIDWNSWSFTEEAVICYIVSQDRILLIRKKRGLGAGKINAPGGRLEDGETAQEAAVRETEEETGITPIGLEPKGLLRFIFTDGYSLKGWVFTATMFTGEMYETDEALPFWCKKESIPWEEMWADDILWLPKVLDNISIHGYFIFSNDTMLSHKVIEKDM